MSNYTPEQMQRFQELYDRLEEVEMKVDNYRDKHPVFKKRFAFLVLGVRIPEYEHRVPEDVKQEFDFDIKGLAEKLRGLMEDDN